MGRRKKYFVEVGKRFGNWTVLEEVVDGKGARALCRCDCGVEKVVWYGHLVKGNITKCRACYAKNNKSHPLYYTWATMKQRCYNTKAKNYESYGGREITVCNRWRNSFEAFLEDMGERPSREHSLDRIDNNKGYSPDNCKWSTHHQQATNTRSTSSHLGVCFDKKARKWRAYITVKNKRHSLGYYETLEEAIQARKDGEIKYLGCTLE